MLYFGFTNETKVKITEDYFSKFLGKTEKLLKDLLKEKMGKRNGIVDLVIIDDARMQDLNAQYRNKNSPTDVISFAYLDIMDKKKLKDQNIIVGDIFISVDTAKHQAKEKKHSLKKEMQILFVHGLLHCLGFDHRNDKEEAEMEGWANRILK